MHIDAHQHVWDLNRADYAWLGPDHPEWNRTVKFSELMPHLERNGITATVLVESADNDEDTHLMFEVAAQYAAVVGIGVSRVSCTSRTRTSDAPLVPPRRSSSLSSCAAASQRL